MKKILITCLILVFGFEIQAQEIKNSSYNPHTLFSPLFYSHNGNQFRSANGTPGPKYWQNRADYNLKTELFPESNTIKGNVIIKYTNNSPDNLDYLWLQLDQNLFKPDSRGQVMISGNSRYGNRGEKINGGYILTNIAVSNSEFTYIIEDTRMQIRLKKPVSKNGGKTEISMDFEFKIPKNGSDRMGHLKTKNGEIYTIAQWYPRMAVYDDVLGWNTKPYLGAGEFYCEYGDVDLIITAPDNQFILASGELTNAKKVLSKKVYNRWEKAKKSDDIIEIIKESEVIEIANSDSKNTKTWQYHMDNTRDVAWAASKAFVIDGSKINLPSGKKSFAISAQPIESNGQDAYGRACEYTKTSIEYYSSLLYEYPYPMAINIAANIGGMEYPGIVFCGWKAKSSSVWSVIDHEFGHNWFPMLVGSNERNFGWMDEGFSTFVNELSARHFNNGEYKNKKQLVTEKLAYNFLDESNEYIMLPPDGLNEKNIGLQLYYKPAVGLKLLRNIVIGKERFDYAFKEYIKHWAFKHPTPVDFYRSIENAAGEDLSWFWRGWFINNYSLDQGISKVEKTKDGYTVTVENLGSFALPVFITAETANGKKIEHNQGVDVWMRNKSFKFFIPTTETVNKVTLDANKQLPDINRSNNTWTKK
ncbi:M1 family metallopeptidase [Thalassobellus suaedae]|uniref:M1 family metallopeptidase n=1 Tax=Thalassobellus suaedae TaxID=3074124 RepID=A0ABY9Y208_9FLAO|nr:M1 family metallopeptidase [Flavobacteriaceae bacterium HL-DH10]